MASIGRDVHCLLSGSFNSWVALFEFDDHEVAATGQQVMVTRFTAPLDPLPASPNNLA